MIMKNLIPMIDFVLEQDLIFPIGRTAGDMVKYGLFLSQKIELWMFIPCKLVDGVWVVLEEPKEKHFYTPLPERNGKKVWLKNRTKFELVKKEYQKEKDRVLFEGFVSCITNRVQSVHHENCSVHFQLLNEETIDSISKNNLELTPTAQKQIGC